MQFTPATFVAEPDEHLVLLPAGLTGTATLADGTVIDLGPADQVVVAVSSLDDAKELALIASDMADANPDIDVTHDAEQSQANLYSQES